MTFAFPLAALLALSAAAPTANRSTMSVEAAGRVVFSDVCLRSVVELRPIQGLAEASGMRPTPPTVFGGGPNDRAWRLTAAQPVHVVGWADGGCTAIVDRGDAAALGAMARSAILARPEGFRAGLSGLFDGGRVRRDVYCAQRAGRWILASITVPGPRANERTRDLSSSVYSRPTPSALCQPR